MCVFKEALPQKMTLEKHQAEGMSHTLGKGIPGRGYSMCKGPEVGLFLLY